jgi:hypothetical protein
MILARSLQRATAEKSILFVLAASVVAQPFDFR